MDNKEKYQLVLDYLNKLIANKKSVKHYQSIANDTYFGFVELEDDDESVYMELKVCIMSLRILFPDGSEMNIGLFEPQKDEVKYLFNKLVEISEENCIKYLKAI